MQQVYFRQAMAADIPSLVVMRAAFLAEATGADPADPVLLDALTRYFSSTVLTGEFIAFLAVAGPRIVATSGLVLRRNPPAAKNLLGLEAYIMNMYTLPPWRGRGIASALLKELVAVARQSNCRRVTLHALPQAVRLYARAAFVAVNDEMKLDLE